MASLTEIGGDAEGSWRREAVYRMDDCESRVGAVASEGGWWLEGRRASDSSTPRTCLAAEKRRPDWLDRNAALREGGPEG
jgi:hypothetical protein